MSRAKLPERLADAVWSVLCVHAGAFADDRHAFIHHVTTSGLSEYRFCGSLGFGGKVWWNPPAGETCPLYVNCYREDETPDRLATIVLANDALAKVWDAWQSINAARSARKEDDRG